MSKDFYKRKCCQTKSAELQEAVCNEESQDTSVLKLHCVSHMTSKALRNLKMDFQEMNKFQNKTTAGHGLSE